MIRMAPSGKFVLRISPQLHRQLAREASRLGISLNQLCSNLLEKNPNLEGLKRERFNFLDPILHETKQRFGKDLVGVAVFGSQVTGQATTGSDLDLLIVLALTVPIYRPLYSWWDEKITAPGATIVNPHFVHLPPTPEEAGSLWLEVAIAHEVLWQRENQLGRVITKILDRIASDRLRRYWSNGQPYWVRTDEEQRPRH